MQLITAENFEAFVCQNADRLAMLNFCAAWNPLDTSMGHVVEEVDSVVGDQLAVAEIDVSDPVNQELLLHLGVTHLPALFFIFRNRVVDYKVGYSKVRLVGHVQQLLQRFSQYAPEPTVPIHPGPFPSGIVLPPINENEPTGDGYSSTGPRTPNSMSPMAANPTGGFPPAMHPPHTASQSFPSPPSGSPPAFGLIPHQLIPEEPKKPWWQRLLS